LEDKKIILLSCGYFDRAFLKQVSGAVEDEYRYQVVTEECHLDLSPFYNPARRQYDGDRLLNQVTACTGTEYLKLIGLFRVDLYIPILTYIFGQAILGRQTAIASVYRLRNELYGLKQDDELLLSRTIKEVIHELGHTFGLVHCHNLSCVMRSSTYAEEIDLKGAALCPSCRSLLSGSLILPRNQT
jgi:archaemetzincin